MPHPSPHTFTMADVVRENARTFPTRTALVCGGGRWTFPEVDARTNRAAAALAARGVGRGGRVVWLGHNCHRLVEALFACAKLGAVLVPVNWRLAPPELEVVLADAAPAAILRHDDPDWPEVDAPDPQAPVDEDDPLVQMYTAAFEGRPRGALLTQRNLLTTNLQLALAQGFGADDVHLASGPLFHVLTLMIVTTVFHVGGTNVMIPRVLPEEMARLIAAERVTRAVVLPPTIPKLVEAAERGGYDLSSLRTIPMPGGPEVKRLLEMTTPDLPPPGGYGQTECAGLVTFNAYGPRGVGRHGRPGPLVALRIVDPQGRELPPGEVGEIVVRGPQVMAGYAGLDEVNEQRFAGGWHHTGDLGRREPDGSVTFVGPATDLIKTGAENVYPAEVEAVLRRHPAVAEACVIGVPDPIWGQSVKAVVALRSPASAEELIDFCRRHLAGYKKPRTVVFVDALPKTPEGAVDREAVKREHGGQGERGGTGA